MLPPESNTNVVSHANACSYIRSYDQIQPKRQDAAMLANAHSTSLNSDSMLSISLFLIYSSIAKHYPQEKK